MGDLFVEYPIDWEFICFNLSLSLSLSHTHTHTHTHTPYIYIMVRLPLMDWSCIYKNENNVRAWVCVRWYDEARLGEMCTFARKRVAEVFLWTVILHFEPHYSRARMMHGKLLKLFSIVDDVYDAYGTKEEHRLFRKAIERYIYF